MKHRFAMTWMLLFLAAPVAPLHAADPPASGPDVMALAPADAWAVVSFRNMAEMDKKIGTLAQQLNVPMPLPNPLTMGVGMLGFTPSAMDPAASVGVVILAAPSFQELENQMVILVPTTNLKELLSLMEPEEVADSAGISKVMIQNQESFVAQKEKHAVVGKSVGAVKAVLESKTSVRSTFGPEQVEHCAGDDLVIWVNAKGVTEGEAFKAVLPMLQMTGVDPAMFNEFRTFTASLRISSAGLGLGLYYDGIPDTPTYKIASSMKGTSESLLTGLPKDRCVLSCGSTATKEASEQGAKVFMKVLDGPHFKNLPMDPAKLTQAKDLLASMMKSTRAFALAISGLPEGPEGLVSLTKVVRVEGDPKALMASMAELVGHLKGGLITAEDAAPFLAALEYKTAAETINGAPVDHLWFDIDKVAPAGESGPPPEVAAVRKVVGKDGILFRMGVVGGDQIVATFGGGADRFKAVADLAKAKQAPLAEDGGIKRSQAHLPPKKNMEAYLSVDRLVALVGTVAKAVEAPMPPVTMPELNAPVAMASAPAGKGGAQTEIFVPMELMIAVKDLAMNMMGGGSAPPEAGPS